MSSLSKRAMRNVEFNESWTLLLKVWSNPYSKENPEGVVAMGVAENKLMHDEIVEYLNSHLKVNKKLLTYNDGPSGSVPLRNALSTFVNKYFNPHLSNLIQPQHISILSGVGACVDAICFCVADAGDGILVCRPAYVGFESDFKDRAHVEPVWVSVGDHDVTGLEAVNAHEQALLEARTNGREVKALLLCNPHNPLGRCYSKEVLEAYLKLCRKYGIHLISDEVYAKAVFPSKDVPEPIPFTSILALDIGKFIDPALVHVLYGMSKDFSCNGLRVGAIISPASAKLHTALSTVAKFSWSSSLSDHAWTLFLNDEKWYSWYFETMTRKMTASYERCIAFLKDWEIQYIPAYCGPFIWLNLRPYMSSNTWEAERTLTHTMISNGVWIATGESFKSEIPGWFRITFAVPEEEFVFGLERLKKALTFAKDGGGEGIDENDGADECGENEQAEVATIVEGMTKM